MKSYQKISKILSICLSGILITHTIVGSEKDHWPIDLFTYISLFSMIFMLDFLFYEVNEKNNYCIRHSSFCTFPITRYRVLSLEIVNYFKRWEIFLFLTIILFYITSISLLNNSNLFTTILILCLYSLQTIFLISCLFFAKSIISEKSFDESLRTVVLSLVIVTNLLTLSWEKYIIPDFMFSISPFSNGFLSFLINENRFILTCLLASITILIMTLVVKSRFKTWLH